MEWKEYSSAWAIRFIQQSRSPTQWSVSFGVYLLRPDDDAIHYPPKLFAYVFFLQASQLLLAVLTFPLTSHDMTNDRAHFQLMYFLVVSNAFVLFRTASLVTPSILYRISSLPPPPPKPPDQNIQFSLQINNFLDFYNFCLLKFVFHKLPNSSKTSMWSKSTKLEKLAKRNMS